MGEATNMYPNLNDQQQFGLDKANKIKDYFIAEIKKKELISKIFNKYFAPFDYSNKSLIALSATSGGIHIASFTTVIGAPVGIASASFSFAFSITAGIVKKILKITRNKKKKHNYIAMLPRSKLNSIETIISKALIDNEIRLEEFTVIINEEGNYRKLKERKNDEKSKK